MWLLFFHIFLSVLRVLRGSFYTSGCGCGADVVCARSSLSISIPLSGDYNFTMAWSENLLLLGAWLREPKQTGALVPSGILLSEAMAAQVNVKGADLVVELGAGTGSISRALLNAGLRPDRLILVEKDGALCRNLRLNFPQIRLLEGDATRLDRMMAEAGVRKAGAMVSSLPLLSMSPSQRTQTLQALFECLKKDGQLIHYTYSPTNPIPVEERRTLGITGRRVAWALLNLPPATVWVYQAADNRKQETE